MSIVRVHRGAPDPPPEEPPTPPEPAPPSTYPFIGSSVYANGSDPTTGTWAQEFAEYQQRFNGMAVVRTFEANAIGNWTSGVVGTAMAQTSRQIAVVHSFKQYDLAAVRTWCENKPDNGLPAWLFYWHEPENDLSTLSAAEWRRRNSGVAGAVRDVGRSDVIFAQCLMRYTLAPASGRNFYDWYTEDAAEVWFDAYNTGYSSGRYSGVPGILDPVVALAKQLGKPWGIGEYGTPKLGSDATGEGRAAWIEQYTDYGIARGARGLCYWSARDVNTGYNSRIDEDPVAYNAFRPYCVASRNAHGIPYEA